MDCPKNSAPIPSLIESGRSSPPSSCAICLGPFKNKSYTENCLHQFCFDCLLTWSKIKTECPLCKQPFKSIIHNIRSNESYDKYIVEQNESNSEMDSLYNQYYSRRFRYRTTLTLRPDDNLAIQRLLLRYPPDTNQSPNYNLYSPHGLTPSTSYASRTRTYKSFRRLVYLQNLWVCPLLDITGRYRQCTPEFYMTNPAQINRLIPWLNRELSVLIHEPSVQMRALVRITELVMYHSIDSRQFFEAIRAFIPFHTKHFIHEFYSFARSPFDMIGYDRSISYRSFNPQYNHYVNELSSSSDSDICVVSSEAGPSNAQNTLNRPNLSSIASTSTATTSTQRFDSLTNPIIETISNSESDDPSDEVIMVGYIKPPEARTPEIVDLLASDSDSIIINEPPTFSESPPITPCKCCHPPPGEIAQTISPSRPSTSGLVKLCVKQNATSTITLSGSDSDNQKNNFQLNAESKSKIPKQTIKIGTSEQTDNNSDSSLSSSSNSSKNLDEKYKRPSTPSRQSTDDTQNFLDKFFFFKNVINQQNLLKKSKRKKHSSSKKKIHHSKRKYKNKYKSKRHYKNKDKHEKKGIHKDKSYNQSKSNKRTEEYDADTESVINYWPRNVLNDQNEPIASTSNDNKVEKRPLKSVVSAVTYKKGKINSDEFNISNDNKLSPKSQEISQNNSSYYSSKFSVNSSELINDDSDDSSYM